MLARALLCLVALVIAGPVYAQTGCVPNPNDNGPPFIDGCRITSAGLNKITGALVSASCHSTFTSPAAGTRGPLFIQSDCPPSALVAGQDQNFQSWMGPLLTATPSASGAVNTTITSDNYNGRHDIWALNAVCGQQPVGNTFGGYTGLPAGAGKNHCVEIDVSQGNPGTPGNLQSPNDPGNVSHGIELVTQSPAGPVGAARPHVAGWEFSANDALNNTITTTGNTNGTTTVTAIASFSNTFGFVTVGDTVTGSDFAANTTITAINLSTSTITLSQAATGSHTGTSITFQSVKTSWWDFGYSCTRTTYACFVASIFSPGEHFASIGTLWDQGGTGSVVAAQGNHDIGILNLQNMSSTDTFIAASVLANTNLIIKNGVSSDVGMTLDSGNGSAIQNSFVQFSDNGTAKWQISKNNGNGFIVFNLASGHSDIFIEPVSEDTYLQGGLIVGNSAIVSSGVHQGEIAMGKDASLAAPGANALKIGWVCGTGAGTAKLIAIAGTSATGATIVDNVGAGVTGC